jgi:hypothetical protein
MGLALGETAILVYTYHLPAEGLYLLYVQGDPSPVWGSSLHGRNVEFDEDNNIIDPLVITAGGNLVFLPLMLKH